MIDTIRLHISDFKFYNAVRIWRSDDLKGNVPARLNGDMLRNMVDCGKVIDFNDYKEKNLRDLLADLNEHGLEIVLKDFFQLYNQGSWSRDITLVIDEMNHRIIVEASIPKFFNGQNVDLLYDYRSKCLDFVCYLYTFFKVTRPTSDEILSIALGRVDICYFYKFESQIHAFDFINAFKMWSKHKRKKIHHYDTSMMFVGRSYSLKFYMKYDEFQKHDKKEINKNLAMLLEKNDHPDNYKIVSDYRNMLAYCDSFSSGMVRSEFTLRRQKLNYDGIITLGDFLNLDIAEYYEGLLSKLGVLKMGHTQKDEYFNQLKSNKKLLQYCALLDTFGRDKLKEVYHRQTIYTYDKMLLDMNIFMGDFNILKSVNLSIREDDRLRISSLVDDYSLAKKFVNGELF